MNLNMELCRGRHETPALDGAIFRKELSSADLTDPDYLESKVVTRLYELCDNDLGELEHLDLYVTGLSVALVAVINVCRQYNIELRLWHYDRDINGYYHQWVR